MANFTFKSVLATAALFAAMSANALEVTISNGVMTLDYNDTTNPWLSIDSYGNGDQAALRQSIKKVVVIGNFAPTTAFTNSNDWGIETLDFSQAVLPENYAFKRLYNLKEIIWPTSEFIIPEHCFELSDGDIQQGSVPSLQAVTIPTNCKEVKAHAFGSHTALETIYIDGPSTILRHESFNNVKNVKDVYIQSGEAQNPATGECFCEFGAFDFWVTWVQTQINRVGEAACLHYPKTIEENIKWYCNPNVDVLTQKVLNDSYHEASNKAKNGWHEFIVNDRTIVKQEQIFRTFSDTKPHLFPKCTNVEEGLKIYYVVGVITVNNQEKILIEPLNETADYVLPANTGALIYTKKGFVIYDVDQTESAQKISQYAALTPLKNTNYLESLQDAPDNYYMSWSSTRRGHECLNMLLNNKKITDSAPVEWGFYTIIPKTYTKDEISYRAYLNFPTSIATENNMHGFYDGNGDVPPTVDQYSSKVFDLTIDEDEEFDGETAGMFTVVRDNISTSNAYYNIAGQQISGPAKGLYIHNGKKFMK